MRINLTTPLSDDKESKRHTKAVIDAIEQYTEEKMSDEYGRIPTDGSRFGGQPIPSAMTNEEQAALVERLREDDTDPKMLNKIADQLESFRQEVSDALDAVSDSEDWALHPSLRRFIIPKPVDSLVIEAREICARVCEGWTDIPAGRAAAYREGTHDDEDDFAYALAALKRGYEIREKNNDQ